MGAHNVCFLKHKISLPNKLTGVSKEYSIGATMVFPAIRIGTGCVSGIICVEKPTVLMDDMESGRFEPLFPMHEYVAPLKCVLGRVSLLVWGVHH